MGTTALSPHPKSGRTLSLARKLGLGALLLALGSVLACGIGIVGLSLSSARLENALNADERLKGYAALSSQISSLAFVNYEPVGKADISNTRKDRIAGLVTTINGTFRAIGTNLERDVANARGLGLNEQSRRATRGLNLARMQASFDGLVRAIDRVDTTPDRVATELTIFSSRFQPLLARAIGDEQRIKDDAYAQIARIRIWLTRAAIAVTVLTLCALAAFYIVLVRPQLGRLERLRLAAREIAAENFEARLPETTRDEIGDLFVEVNRMADQLGRDRAMLNDTIASQTEKLRAANAKLTSVDTNRRRFFADISHEMRTPLTVILMEAELAQKEAAGPQTFEAIISRARLLSRRIDDLLRISKSESGILSIEHERFDLQSAAQSAMDDLARRAERLGFSLRLAPSDPAFGPAQVIGDHNWIRQVITGLVDNALRHAGHECAIEMRIIHGAQAHMQTHMLQVIDAGAGMAQADQATAFERFARGTDQAEGSNGFGIGLGLAKWVVEEHGGTITLASPPPDENALVIGKGTMVALRFPAHTDQAAHA